jgi:hypothetical protein
MKSRITLLVAILALGSDGCGPKRRKFVMPDVPPLAAKPLPEAVIEAPPEIDTPVPIFSPEWPEMSPAENPSAPKPAPGKKPQPTHPPATPATPPETETPVPPVVQPTPVPRLGEELSDERRREYEADYNRFVTGARDTLKHTTGRRLNPAQQEQVANVRVFLKQAEDSRAKDLALAMQLARRAYLLGQELLKSLR